MNRKLLLLSLLSVFLFIFPVFTYACSKPTSGQGQLKAAIIDQFGGPNERFILGVTQELESNGFAVTIFEGDEINVDLYRELPDYGFRLIIFRVHSNLIRGSEPFTGRTYLFTSENYTKSGYISHQLVGRIVPAKAHENSPTYYAVSADYIAEFSAGSMTTQSSS